MDLIITILPVVTKDLSNSPRFTPYVFLSRCKFSNLTTRQPMVEFYLLMLPHFPLRKKERKSYFGKNRTHDFRTSRTWCAGYLLDHSVRATRAAYHIPSTTFGSVPSLTGHAATAYRWRQLLRVRRHSAFNSSSSSPQGS